MLLMTGRKSNEMKVEVHCIAPKARRKPRWIASDYVHCRQPTWDYAQRDADFLDDLLSSGEFSSVRGNVLRECAELSVKTEEQSDASSCINSNFLVVLTGLVYLRAL